jgi:hypothetical protein
MASSSWGAYSIFSVDASRDVRNSPKADEVDSGKMDPEEPKQRSLIKLQAGLM